jgi:hypothetical protein
MLVNCGKGIEMDVRIEDLNKTVLDHVIYIGLKNVLQDAGAGKSPGDARTKAENKLAAMYRGEVRAQVGRTVNTSAQRELMQTMLEVWAKDEGLSRKRAETIAKEILAKKYAPEPKPVKGRKVAA